MIGLGKQRGGLYYLSPGTAYQHTPQSHNVSVQHDLWHKRLGHPSYAHLQGLAKSFSEISFSYDNKPCDVCPLAKQTRLPFGVSYIFTV